MWKKSQTQTVFLLAPLVLISALAQDIYVPTLPDIVHSFNTTPGRVQLTLSLFMVFTGLSQLIIGPLSDQYGRRLPALWSTGLYVLGSLLCSLAPSINILILGRIIEAIGGCGALVISFAIVRDCHSGQKASKIFSYINAVVCISPLIAPFLGASLNLLFNWRAPFIFLTLIGAFTFLILKSKFKESQNPQNKVKLNLKLFKRYYKILNNINFITYGFCATSGLTVFFTYFSSSPYLLISDLHVPESHFGFYFALIAALSSSGSLTAAHMISKISIFKLILLGSIGMLLSAALMISWYLIAGLSLTGFLVPMGMAGFSCSLLFGAGAAGALEPFGDMAGTAAALLGAFEFMTAAIIGTFVLQWEVHSTLPLGLTVLVLGIVNLCICGVYYKKSKK